MIRGLINLNKKVCEWIERRLPQEFTPNLLYYQRLAVAELAAQRPGLVILDLGSGADTPFVRHLNPGIDSSVIGIDVLWNQISKNTALDYGIVADICRDLPLRDGCIDIVVTRSLLEHLPDSSKVFNEINRVLRLGGVCVHVFPAKFSPFSIINQLIPPEIAKRVLQLFFPEWEGEVGFRAYYHYCYYPAIFRQHQKSGFVIRDAKYRYYQSVYFQFFAPLFTISLAYDYILYRLRVRSMACQIFMVAEKLSRSDEM